MSEYIESSLHDLIKARQSKLDNNEFYIVAVSLPFKNFPITNCDNTIQILQTLKNNNLIDELITEPKFIKETEARTLALNKIIENNCEIVWQYDPDEELKIEQISKIIKFVNLNPFVACFKLSYRNFVFDNNTYLVEPFCPMRIHRVNYSNYRVNYFWDDNNIMYGGKITRDLIRDIDFTMLTIPKSYVWISHMTWISNSRSEAKILYQKSRSWTCSYDWDYINNKLIFNKDYFEKFGLPLPQIAQLSTTLG